MGDFDPAFIRTLAVQSWTMYGIGVFLILLRMYARIHRLGFKGLQTDDYLMLVAAGLYTMLITCLNVISANGGSNLYLPEYYPTFSPENIQQRIKGSKIVIVSEQAMLNVIYTIKACMLIMYSRLTLGLQIQKMVVYLSIYVLVGWVATEIAFFTACRPFNGYWAMPPPNPQCTTLEHYAIVQACFNISSDTLMLFIPLPLITRLNMPLKQKAVLTLIFSMGVFVILAAILTKVFNLSNIYDPSYMLWYTREASVSVYVSNLPLIWPLLREWFPILRSMTPGQKLSSSNERQNKRSGYEKHPSTNTITHNHRSKSRTQLSTAFASKRLSDYDYESSGPTASKTGIITTIIRGKTDQQKSQQGGSGSQEELSRGDHHREGVVKKVDSWELAHPNMSSKSNPNLAHGSGSGSGDTVWESGKGGEMTMGDGIQIQTTVQVVEDFIGESEEDELPLPLQGSRTGDVEMGVLPPSGAGDGRPRGFEWDFKGGK